MSSEIVQIDYEKVQALVQRFAKQHDSVNHLKSNLARTVEQLKQTWQGDAANAFFNEVHADILPSFDRLLNVLAQAQAVSLEIKKIFEAAEREAAAQIKFTDSPANQGTIGAAVTTMSAAPPPNSKPDDDDWSFMGMLHEGLDWAGFIPGLGAVPDLINAGLYAIEGDWGNAAFSGAAAIPIIGDIAKGADKVRDVAKIVDKADGLIDAGRAIDRVDDAADIAKKFPIQKPHWKGLDDTEDKIFQHWDDPKKRSFFENRYNQRYQTHANNVDDAIANGRLAEAQASYPGVNINDRRLQELSLDPSSKSFKFDEGLSALRAEERGVLPGPVRRSLDGSGGESGLDLVDGNFRHWDVKDARHGSDKIAETIRNGENVLIDDRNFTPAQRQELFEQLKTQFGGQIDPEKVRFVEFNY